MAHSLSQKKRNRQNVVRHERNKAIKSEIKTRIRRALAAAESGDADAADAAVKDAQQRIDRAVSKGVIHANTAARRKSRLVAAVRTKLSA